MLLYYKTRIFLVFVVFVVFIVFIVFVVFIVFLVFVASIVLFLLRQDYTKPIRFRLCFLFFFLTKAIHVFLPILWYTFHDLTNRERFIAFVAFLQHELDLLISIIG